ncbi:hypothetical protein [Kitasatospora kifunensis]
MESTEMTGDTATVPDLARTLLQGVGNEAVNAAVGLLAAHQDGFWLRELLEPDGALASAVTREEGRPWVEWDAVGALIDRGLPQSSSETAVLAVAASSRARPVLTKRSSPLPPSSPTPWRWA